MTNDWVCGTGYDHLKRWEGFLSESSLQRYYSMDIAKNECNASSDCQGLLVVSSNFVFTGKGLEPNTLFYQQGESSNDETVHDYCIKKGLIAATTRGDTNSIFTNDFTTPAPVPVTSIPFSPMPASISPSPVPEPTPAPTTLAPIPADESSTTLSKVLTGKVVTLIISAVMSLLVGTLLLMLKKNRR